VAAPVRNAETLVVRARIPGDFAAVPPRRDRFEREANAVAERLAAVEAPVEAAAPGPARPLPPALRAGFERQLPYDLSSVRLHTDGAGHETARRLGARAVTVGRDVSFARGAYDPGSRAGRRLLAHEVVHTAQQGALPARAGAGPAVSRSPAGVAQRTPGVDADDSWRELIVGVTVVPEEKGRRDRGEEASKRFRMLPAGVRLINSLWRLARGKSKLRFRIGVWFVDQLPKAVQGIADAAGWFHPEDSNADRYDVYVKNVHPYTGGGVTIAAFTDPESNMAETLHHELLHVEFVRAGLGIRWPTGHGPDPAKQTEPLFAERTQAFANELSELEKKIHSEAKEREQQAEAHRLEQERLREEAEAKRRPAAAEPKREAGPSFVGGQVLAEGGVVGLGGTRGTAIVGADLILGRIASFHLGARGVLLSPKHVLAGGTVGFRLSQTGESRLGEQVENPLFFDLEAGVLAELRPEDADRLTKHVALLGSAGVGQEFGTSGTRIFWKVSGYVIISDRKQPEGGAVGGGATAGVGVRF
jgi:hypothetical protein